MRPYIFFIMLISPFVLKSQTGIEKNGVVEVEAENFNNQTLDEIRKWYLIKGKSNPDTLESRKLKEASGNSYIKILPDTRIGHSDPLINGENFSNEPGKMAIISYSIEFQNTGRYYVWARVFSTGTEDNGVHVGLDGEWPESGQRMQWCEDKFSWTWASKQRTQEEHCGEERLIYLDIESAGIHQIMFSMREDGFSMDKWRMVLNYDQTYDY
ncbi:hypothetical protein [Algoriphagus sp.]|uniref:hypothetical protein n=1 Tax=Algoriphagus sp. TaxID=1872435 RepID=UPI00391C78E6